MYLRIAAILTLFIGLVPLHACVGPENVFGIQFNNGESIDVSIIENLGEEGVNYKKIEANGVLKYSFRSHYNSSIMVEVTTLPDTAKVSGVATFTVDTSVVKMKDFPFGPCVRTELDWLVGVGVIAMDRLKREKIEKSFNESIDKMMPASFFWTKQDSLLPNNWTFNDDGSIAAPNIRCGPTDFSVADLPPQSLDSVVGIVTKDTKVFSRGSITGDPAGSSMLLVDINGRLQAQKMTGMKPSRPGVFVGYDRRSGVVKRVIALQ